MQTYLNLAKLLEKTGKIVEAAQTYKKAKFLSHDNPQVDEGLKRCKTFLDMTRNVHN